MTGPDAAKVGASAPQTALGLMVTRVGGPTCHGCRSNLYTATWGQEWDRRPHSRCSALNQNIPMILGPHDKWLESEAPGDCPENAKRKKVQPVEPH